DARCPQVDGRFVCTWPGSLALDVTGNAASFVMRVSVERDLPVALPGAREQWPIDVLVDGAAVPVREPGGVPCVDLTRGAHTISGRFLFGEAPSTLRLPANVGALSLRRAGTPVAHPRREPDGLLWIEEGASEDDGEQSLTLSVHRRIEDALPLRSITRIAIRAAGKSREIAFDDVLVEGARPIELRADLPTQLSPDGALRLQVQGGSYQVEIVSILDAPPRALSAPKLPAPWPEQEVWVFRADDVLRHVELSGPQQIDAARTDLAPDWRGLPTFLLTPGQALSFDVRRRGEQEPAPNQLRLARSLWLDLDGDGYTVRDELGGTMHQGFRLDLEQGTLGRAVVNGEDALITRRAKQSGVELRTGSVALTTEWRLEHGQRDLAAVGYSEDVDSLSATLHLPPGYLLLAASGADSAQGTWFDRWDLFDFFFVLALALAVGKLAGVWWGVLALFALVLAQHEPNAPGGVWFFLLASSALVRAIPSEGKGASFARVLLGIATVALLLAWVPFAAQQIRSALYPQLAGQESYPVPVEYSNLIVGGAPAPAAMEAPQRDEEGSMKAEERGSGYALEDLAQASGVGISTARKKTYSQRELLDPSAIVQTGPGIPNWSFQQYALAWSGPVTQAERLHLWLVPPFAMRAWALASAILTGLLLFALLNATRQPPPTFRSQPPTHISPGSEVAVTTFCALLLCVPVAHAQPLEPSPDLLEELRHRLLKPPACAPSCLSVPSLALTLGAQRLDIQVQLHAGEGAVYRAPGPLAQWSIDRVRIDGVDAFTSARLDDGFLHVRVPAGIHRLELSGPVPSNQAWTLALGGPAPHRVEAQARGWVVEGLHADGSAEPNLELRPEVASTQKEAGAQPLVQWLEVQRELELGLRFQIRTTVTRLGPASEGVTLRLPLWTDESVNEAGLRAEDGHVLVSLPRDQSTISFVSTLPPRAKLEVEAATPLHEGVLRHPYSEHWVIRPGPLYRISLDGPPALAQTDASGDYAPSFRPYPGEKLTVFAERLAAEAGASVTIDRVEQALRPGARSEEGKLSLSLRASRGTTERIVLPKDAKLAGVTVDGQPHPARAKEGTVEIPLAPGAHTIELTTERSAEMGFDYSPALPKVDRAVSNVRVNVSLPPDRWLLATRGPAWGPAILWWGYLVLVLLIAVALGRVPNSPLRSWQWALLGFGLARVETAVALIVVGWFFALAYRERDRIQSVRLFYLLQAALVMFTIVALSCLTYAVQQGLLVAPDMQVQGMQSSQSFVQWYVDRTPGPLPAITVWSAPMWIYKSLMLLWALWLAASLVAWLRWGWAAFRKGGATRRGRGGPLFGRGAPVPTGPAGASPSADSERAGVP
ncbi:MAG TPA: hypothetical protein VFX59_22835, partial [Polyangiales bacterium]|nr:hypothetical protein [Polyangiales bacterium]